MTRKRPFKVFIERGKDREWYYKTKAGNGEIVHDSEGHKNLDDCLVIASESHPGLQVILIQEDGSEVTLVKAGE